MAGTSFPEILQQTPLRKPGWVFPNGSRSYYYEFRPGKGPRIISRVAEGVQMIAPPD